MIEFCDLLDQLAPLKSPVERKKVLREAIDANAAVGRLLFEALSPTRVFNVKRVAPCSYRCRIDLSDYAPVFTLLDALDAGLRGNQAKRVIDNTLGLYSERQQEALVRVLTKQLRAGIDAATVNEVAPGLIPTFPIALAKKFTGKTESIQFPVWADIKYDGYRQVAKVRASDADCEGRASVRYFSREGREGDKYKGHFDAELLALRERFGFDIAVDGEALGTSFSATQQARGEDGDEHIGQMRMFVFTILPLEAFESQSTTDNELDRINTKTRALSGFERLVSSEGRLCHTEHDMREAYAYALSKKYEGLILKKLLAPYSFKRSDAWLKWKPVMTDLDGQVTDVFEGEPGSALAGNLGGVVVRGTTEDGDVFQCRMGSGFGLKTRTQWWSDHTGQPQSYETFKNGVASVHTCLPSGRPVVGRWVEMEGQELSQALGREGVLSVRFPVFKREREPK